MAKPTNQGFLAGWNTGLEAMKQTASSRYNQAAVAAKNFKTEIPYEPQSGLKKTSNQTISDENFTELMRARDAQTATQQTSGNYGPSTVADKDFKQLIRDAQISLKETPGAFLGAYTARVLGDIANQETRSLWWSVNHPIALVDKASAALVDPKKQLNRYQRAAIVGSFATPAFALSGAYDPSNISELGRPEGYKQNVPNPDDPTKSLDPATELFERFMLGRQGRPLAYDKAKEEIPSLTKERYTNYMKFMYNDPAFLGSVKVTSENLQGVPEARVFGYPVSIPTVTTAVGGIAGAKLGLATASRPPKAQQLELLSEKASDVASAYKPRNQTMRGVTGGLAGAAAGAIAGVLANQALAARQVDSQLSMR